MTAPTATPVAPTDRRHADAAALTEVLVERAAQDDRQTRASIDALTRLLVHTLDQALPSKGDAARAIARTVAESFISGETLEMTLLRATATADTLSLSEPVTRQVQRVITESLTSTDVLAPLVSPVTEGSALSEAALASVLRKVAPFSTPEAPPADIPGGVPVVSSAKRNVLQEASHRRPAGISVARDEFSLELSPDEQRNLPYRRSGAWAGKQPKHVIAWAAFAALTPLAIWFAHTRMTSDMSTAPYLPLSSPPIAAAPLAAPRPNAPAAEQLKTAPSSGLATEVRGRSMQAAPAPPPQLITPPKSPESKVSARGRDLIETAQLRPSWSENAHEAGPLGLPAVTRMEPRETSDDPDAIIDWLLGKRAHRKH